MQHTKNLISRISDPISKWLKMQAGSLKKTFKRAKKAEKSLNILSEQEKTILKRLTEKSDSASNKFKKIVSLMAKIETKKMFEILDRPVESSIKSITKNIQSLASRLGLFNKQDFPWKIIINHFAQEGKISIFKNAANSWSDSEINPGDIYENYEESSIRSLWTLFIEEIFEIIELSKKLNSYLNIKVASEKSKKEMVFKYLIEKNTLYTHLSKHSDKENKNYQKKSNSNLAQMFLIQDSAMKWASFYIQIGSI